MIKIPIFGSDNAHPYRSLVMLIISFFKISSLTRTLIFKTIFLRDCQTMRTYLKISTEYAKELTEMKEKLHHLCDKIEVNEDWTACFPKGGNLITVIQLLSKKRVDYEIQVMKNEA